MLKGYHQEELIQKIHIIKKGFVAAYKAINKNVNNEKNVSINSFTKEELHKYVLDLGEKI